MKKILLLLGILALFLTACGKTAEPPLPTRTPLPTFTPTTVGDVAVAPPVAQQPAAQQPAGQEPVAQEQPTPIPVEAPTDTPIPPTPTPSLPQVVINTNMNVRQGPGTNYNIAGQATEGQRYDVTGQNGAGTWWQINFNGGAGWVFGDLVTAENAQSVAVAANIPAPPPPPPTSTPVPPTATPVPAAPTAPPAPRYKFNVAVVGRCDRQPAGTWFEGKTYVNGQPQSGYKVAFSYAPDGPWITNPMLSGPHEGYKNWDQGYYSHIISSAGPKAGSWYVWIVDDGGNRISEMANWNSTGPGEGCNQAVVDFDSR